MRRAIAVTGAGIGVCLALCAAPALASAQALFGISNAQTLDGKDLPKMRSTGVRTLRFAINWFGVQPNPGSPNLGPTDKLVGDLAARGIRPVPFVYGSPPWIAKKPNRPPLDSAEKVQAWRNFLALVVERYGRGGTYWTDTDGYQQAHPGADPKPITDWQIWNEPNLPKFFPRRNLTRRYAKLVRISHSAITAVDPLARVVLAGLTGYARPTAWTFLDKLYRVGGIKHDFDAVALHPYAANIDQFRTAVGRIHRVVKKHNDSATPLWLTEVGWGSAHPTRRFPLNKGARGQKRMLRSSFKLVLHQRRSWHIQRLFWFDWRDPAGGTGRYCSFCPSAGLLRHNHEPKPAYHAFSRFTRAG
jgi:polysaccharide biosynthesis protein PslG